MAVSVLALWPDLMFATQINEMAKRLGVTTAVTQTADDLLRQVATGEPALIIVDLEIPDLPVRDLITKIRAAGPEAMVIAVGTHVEQKLRAEAQAAGAQMVMVRSDFSRHLLALLTKYGS